MTRSEQNKEAARIREECIRALISENQERFLELMDAAYAERGWVYRPKLTSGERAKKQVEDKRAKAQERELAKLKKAIAKIRETAVANGLPDPYTDEEAAALAHRQVVETTAEKADRIAAEAEAFEQAQGVELDEMAQGSGLIVADGPPDSPEFLAAREALASTK
jgi:hypothetical protein